MEKVIKKLSEKYPDVNEVVKIYNDMVKECCTSDMSGQKDEKYRPFPLLVGILYKVQQRAQDPVKLGGVELEDVDQVMNLLGFYWHHIETVGKKIRDGLNTIPANKENEEKLKEKIEKNRFDAATSLGITHADFLRVWLSELGSLRSNEDHRLSRHCVDYTISLDHPHQCIVLAIFGTRIFPRPNVHDVVMDLVGSPAPFLDGQAHGGMVTGCRNLQQNCMEHLLQGLRHFPGYSLLVVGYSLGAALAQLFTMDLLVGSLKHALPANTSIRAITYGCPPVYTGSHIPAFDNILAVNNNHDGISGACVKNLNDIFLKTRAIERLNLKRRIMIKMLFYGCEEKDNGDNGQSYSQDSNIDDSLSLNSFIMEDEEFDQQSSETDKIPGRQTSIKSVVGKTLSGLLKTPEIDHWNTVESAIGSVPPTSDPCLRHVSKHILNIKRANNEVTIKRFSGFHNYKIFSDKMRLKSGMFDSHMPWSYSNLFAGFGDRGKASKIPIAVLDDLGNEMEPKSGPKFAVHQPKNQSLYPDLQEMMAQL